MDIVFYMLRMISAVDLVVFTAEMSLCDSV